MIDQNNRYAKLRQLPQLDALLNRPNFQAWIETVGKEKASRLARETLVTLRDQILNGEEGEDLELTDESLLQMTQEREHLENCGQIRPLINATGIVLHTNLGRAPLPKVAVQQVYDTAIGYSNLEYRLAEGRRGSRYDSIEPLLQRLTGAEAALVVNNNAAAVLLILSEIAREKEVVLSRSELVEIGGAFRVPDVMKASGAKLVEVGCTNKTHLKDYEQAITDQTAAILKVHRSNFALIGFTEEPELSELRQVCDQHKIPLIYDLGSGLLNPCPPRFLEDEPTVAEALKAGCDLICFSGDKLLGGPQAGIIIGRKKWVDRLKKHPLTRALRCDKMTLVVLQSVLQIYEQPQRICKEIPLYQALEETQQHLEERADILCDLLSQREIEAQVTSLQGEVGGGSAPGVVLPSVGIRIDLTKGTSLNVAEKALRLGEPSVIAYGRDNGLYFDLRTVPDEQLDGLLEALVQLRKAGLI